MTIRVLVVDDQSMVRAGFRLLLADEPDMEVVAEASNGLEAVAQAARFHPDVILMDIRMPELDGLEATRRILAADSAARVLVLTTFNLDEYVYEALLAGASGFVLKDDPPEQLIAAVRIIAGGEALLSSGVTRRVIEHFTRLHRQAPPASVDSLTAREMEVFSLITRGLSKPLTVRTEPEARLLLGIAQLEAGKKDDAVKTFRSVKGDKNYERLANLWSLHARQA